MVVQGLYILDDSFGYCWYCDWLCGDTIGMVRCGVQTSSLGLNQFIFFTMNNRKTAFTVELFTIIPVFSISAAEDH